MLHEVLGNERTDRGQPRKCTGVTKWTEVQYFKVKLVFRYKNIYFKEHLLQIFNLYHLKFNQLSTLVVIRWWMPPQTTTGQNFWIQIILTSHALGSPSFLTWCDDWLNCIRIVAKIIKWSCGLTSWTILAVSDVTSLARLSHYHHNCYLCDCVFFRYIVLVN